MQQTNQPMKLEFEEKDTLWLPEPWQIIPIRNPNYLKSLFIGLTNPLWQLPFMIFSLLIQPLLRGVFTIFVFTIKTTIYGLSGNLTGLPLAKPEIRVLINNHEMKK